jgi:hypothetical protein
MVGSCPGGFGDFRQISGHLIAPGIRMGSAGFEPAIFAV